MADIVNLRRARKARARVEKEAQAAQNRLSFGLSASERRAGDSARDKAERHIDEHLRENADGPDTTAPTPINITTADDND